MKILHIVTGSIAAIKAPEIVREFKKLGHSVTCVMTKSANYFTTETALAYLSENKVYTKMFEPDDESEMAHIKLSRNNDVILVAPASADFIAKLAHGLCDDLASTICIASDKKVILAPAMNTKMLEYPATQENLKKLKSFGFEIIEPTEGLLACGEEGSGKMADVESIINSLIKKKNGKLSGKKIIVTAGATIEEIDPVRYISNYSSGKQGYAIANALIAQGAKVTLISGKTNLPKPNCTFIEVRSAEDMLRAIQTTLPVDCFISCAAVSDWKIKDKSKNKIKKTDSNELTLNLIKNPDILAEISNLKKNRPELVIGFSAETENLIENSKKKLKAKNCDIMIANDVSKDTFGSDHNSVSIIEKKGIIETISKTTKEKIAKNIADLVSKKLK